MVADPAGSAELAVLHTLAHLGYATIEHVHALCFAAAASSTVRLRLAALRAAGCIALTPWRLPRVCQERGSVWTLTPTGHAYLQAYGVQVEPAGGGETGVPSTALERDEWRVRMAVRSLVVRLILQARVRPLCGDLRVWVRSWWPAPYAPPPVHGDAELAIVWTPETVKAPDWLPWQAVGAPGGSGTRYLLCIDRPLAVDAAPGIMHLALADARRADATAVIVWESTERLHHALRHLAARDSDVPRQPVRMTTHALLDRDLATDRWRDAHGRVCSLRPTFEELRPYHAPRTA